jgi:hypothetical protein
MADAVFGRADAGDAARRQIVGKPARAPDEKDEEPTGKEAGRSRKKSRERDEFSVATKRLLAERVAYRCSKPDCPELTVGPLRGSGGRALLGNAAHITAAGKKGPRRNDALSPEERRAPANGIWLCIKHAKHVDEDDTYFTVEMLQKWKKQAEERTYKEMDRPQGRPTFETDDVEAEFRESLGLPKRDKPELVGERLREAAKRDLEAHIRVQLGVQPVNLTLRDDDSKEEKTLSGLAGALERGDHITLVAGPGTGKTTTLLQLGKEVLSQDHAIAVFVPLAVWAVRAEGLLEYLPQLAEYHSFRPQHFMLLAYFGKLVILLDGWNEVGADARLRCITEIQSLSRQYPLLGTAITTRAEDGIPLKGHVVNIEPLSEPQQIALAQTLHGDDGEALGARERCPSGRQGPGPGSRPLGTSHLP